MIMFILKKKSSQHHFILFLFLTEKGHLFSWISQLVKLIELNPEISFLLRIKCIYNHPGLDYCLIC